jgi:hypothetical protein
LRNALDELEGVWFDEHPAAVRGLLYNIRAELAAKRQRRK